MNPTMKSGERKVRVAIVVSHPIQHFVYLYKALAQSDAIQLKVFFASKIGVKPYFDKDMNVEIRWAADLLGGYDSEFLSEADCISQTGFWEINNPSITPALKKFMPDVVQLHGYAQLTLLRALVWCSFRRIPVLLWSDSSLLFKREAWKQYLKSFTLPWVLRLYYGVYSTGDNNAAYYRRYGIKDARIFSCPFTVDETSLCLALENKPVLREQFRTKYVITDDEIILLFVAKLVERKRPQDLLDALKRAQEKLGNTVKLVAFFAGNGILLDDMIAQAKLQNIRAIFAGFINVDELPSIYAMSDILVFPSAREPYGLSAREAICLGLPLIVSDQIGCIGETDAARPEFNALVYPATNVQMLSEHIVTIVTSQSKYKAMSEASLKVATEMNVNKSVQGFVTGVKDACERI
jgi:glycosyltransferase involved in cell wall biosynthesis